MVGSGFNSIACGSVLFDALLLHFVGNRQTQMKTIRSGQADAGHSLFASAAMRNGQRQAKDDPQASRGSPILQLVALSSRSRLRRIHSHRVCSPSHAEMLTGTQHTSDPDHA